jgi:hypothetical protein
LRVFSVLYIIYEQNKSYTITRIQQIPINIIHKETVVIRLSYLSRSSSRPPKKQKKKPITYKTTSAIRTIYKGKQIDEEENQEAGNNSKD